MSDKTGNISNTQEDQIEMMQRIHRDIIDSYDEELEMEVDDRDLGEPAKRYKVTWPPCRNVSTG